MPQVQAISAFFDYDELEQLEALETLTGPVFKLCPQVEERAAEPLLRDENLSDGSVSEVWPGDIPASDSLSTDDWSEDEEAVPDEIHAWEVIISRCVMRAFPDLNAPVTGICTLKELVFEHPDPENPDWVRLERGRGYILKDGSKKDPQLGHLLKPFRLAGVPAHAHHRVLELIRDAWMQMQEIQSTFMKVPTIKRLRSSCESAILAASRGADFVVEDFDSQYTADVQNHIASELQNMAARATVHALASPTVLQSLRGNSGGLNYQELCSAKPSFNITISYAMKLLQEMGQRRLPSAEDASLIIAKAAAVCGALPSLVSVQLPPKATMHVVGDLHGQYFDFLRIIEMYGAPSRENQYLFNGDFVDRGQFSVEVALALFAMKVAAPSFVHMNRGNHEAGRMNTIYGFLEEAVQKYSSDIFGLFCQAFNNLPLATVINASVFVVHGGLSTKAGLRLHEIADIDRKREPDEQADMVMLELLWSDPMPRYGIERSPRGGGILFGPDVTERFCQDNNLSCIIRSHEMKQEGYEWHHDDMCLTVFSAPNYCGFCGNSAAVCNITARAQNSRISVDDFRVETFEATHPSQWQGSGIALQ